VYLHPFVFRNLVYSYGNISFGLSYELNSEEMHRRLHTCFISNKLDQVSKMPFLTPDLNIFFCKIKEADLKAKLLSLWNRYSFYYFWSSDL